MHYNFVGKTDESRQWKMKMQVVCMAYTAEFSVKNQSRSTGAVMETRNSARE